VNHLILRRSELISIAIALLMLLAIGIFSALDWAAYLQNRREVVAARQISENTSLLLLAVTDAETGQRGYLLTGDAAYLAPYTRAVSAIPSELNALGNSVTDHAQKEKVGQLRSLIRAKLDELSRTIELREQGDLEGSLNGVTSGKGAELMAAIRRLAADIGAQQNALITTRSNTVRFGSDRAHLITLLGCGALLIILALGAFNITAASNRREQLIADLEKQRGQTAEVRDLLQTTLASIGDAVLVTDAAGRITFMNRIAESLTGWKASEAVGKNEAEVLAIVDESTRQPAKSPVQSVLRTNEVIGHSIPSVLTTKSGTEIPIDDSGAPIKSQSGIILGVVMVFRDVSGRRAAERDREQLLAEARRSRAEAEQQRSHLHSLFQQAPAIINIHRGPDHVYELVHPLTKDLLGADVTGMTAREAAPNPRYPAILDDVYTSGESRSVVEMPVTHAGGDATLTTRYFNYICCPWRDHAGAVAGVMTLAIDVTEQVLIRRAMRATEEQLRETAKLESLGVLAGGIAHDFNNLLVGIIGNSSLALETLSPDDPLHPMIGDVLRAGERAATLTRQMLAYSGKGRFVIESVDISTLTEEMLPLISGSVPRTVAVRTHLAKDLPPVEADVAQLQQVFMNLVINAAEACEGAGGLVSIVTRRQAVDDFYIRTTFGHAELAPGEYVSLEVADNGCGMDNVTRAKIFDPFFTTKFTGRGLGLSAVLGIIRSHKGAIKVYSEQGKGSTFRVLFPAAAQVKVERIAPAATSLFGAPALGTVLIVDDEDLVRRMARSALEQLGYSVVDAGDGAQALDAFRAHRADIDLVILDLTMPTMSGQETLGAIRTINPHVPIILSSGFTETEATRHFEGKGLAGFLQKPYTISQLSERVRSVLTLK
jgi:two-component system cell cycle sensor histidine kinase/response regulator CckA